MSGLVLKGYLVTHRFKKPAVVGKLYLARPSIASTIGRATPTPPVVVLCGKSQQKICAETVPYVCRTLSDRGGMCPKVQSPQCPIFPLIYALLSL